MRPVGSICGGMPSSWEPRGRCENRLHRQSCGAQLKRPWPSIRTRPPPPSRCFVRKQFRRPNADGVTLTCATPGSGLVATDISVLDLVTVTARGVTVDGLVLDASRASDAPLCAFND